MNDAPRAAASDGVRGDTTTTERRRPPGLPLVVASVLSFLLLDLIFTYDNRVSTFGIVPRARLSIELLLAVGVLALLKLRRAELPRVLLWLGGAVVATAALVRYVDVTAPGVLGRRFDLNADLPHVGNVVSMFLESLPTLQKITLVGAVLLVVAVLVALCVGALRILERGLDAPLLRRLALASATLALVAFTVSAVTAGPSRDTPSDAGAFAETETEASENPPDWDPWVGRQGIGNDDRGQGLFAEPVSAIVARQIATVRRGSGELRLRSVVPSTLDGLRDENGSRAHVVLVFLESYGVTLIDDPQHWPYIEEFYRGVEARLRGEGYSIRSVRAISPTFGGGSWRAHATLMSGIRIDNEQLYDRLLESEWRGLPHLLAEKGYRTLAAEPGIRDEWPEAGGLRLDTVYDAEALDYRGPSIGWWVIPDQYTLYKIGRAELQDAERPVFAKISLILSHIPYLPIPPIVEDWSRFEDGSAYASALPSVGADDYRDLVELSIRYVAAFKYELEILERWLIDELPENTLVIICGDHQPPMLATHSNDSWDVPLHVLSRRGELVDAFAENGFAPGLRPPPEARIPMESFLPIFLEIFDR